MNDIYISLEQIGRLLKERSKFIIVSAILFTSLYLYVVKFYGKSFGIFYYKKFSIEIPFINPKPNYNFYSGVKNGVYHDIGEILNKNNTDEFINIKNVSTLGGYSNVLKVLGDPEGKSFGLVQEEAYNNDKMVRSELNYITPIYMERLYITYISSKNDTLQHRISSNTSKRTLKFLSSRRIDIGPPNSGTHIISRYIINQLNSQIASHNQNLGNEEKINYIDNISNFNNSITLKNLKDGNSEVVLFMISGSPNKNFSDLLLGNSKGNKYNLIGIEPDFTAELNEKYKINLHFTSFDNKHKEFYKITTIGTFAWLVTPHTTSPADIREFLICLDGNKEQLLSKLGIYKSKNQLQKGYNDMLIQSPLDEFNFLGHYNNKNEKVIDSTWRNLLLFFISLVPSTVLFFHVITLLLSISKTDRFHDILVGLLNNNIPSNNLPSVFYFAKLNSIHDCNELNDSEYKYLKENTISIMLEAVKKEERNNKFGKAIKKLKTEEIAKLISILITYTNIDWSKSNFNIIKKVTIKTSPPSDCFFEEDQMVATELEIEINREKGAFNKKQRMIKLLKQILNYAEFETHYNNKSKNDKNDQTTFVYPFIKQDQISIINRIIEGISKVEELKIRISEDYTNGLLTEKHYNFLYSKMIYILERMQNSLTIRLSGLITKQDKLINENLLTKYYVSNYINRKDYYYLIDKVNYNLNWGGNY